MSFEKDTDDSVYNNLDYDLGYNLTADVHACSIHGHYWSDNELGGRECLECTLKEGPQPYLMGTPQETFLLNWKHFGLRRAIHRQLERWCSQNYGRQWKIYADNRQAIVKLNMEVWKLPWYAKYVSKLEFLTRNWGIKKRK